MSNIVLFINVGHAPAHKFCGCGAEVYARACEYLREVCGVAECEECQPAAETAQIPINTTRKQRKESK